VSPARSVGGARTTTGGMSRAADRAMRDALVPGAALIGVAYVLIGHIHARVGPAPGWLGPVETASAALLLLGAAIIRRRSFGATTAQLLGMAIVAPVLLNNALFLYATAAPQHTFGLYIVAIGLAGLSFRTRAFAALLASCLGVWVFGFAVSDAPLAAWSEPAIVMASMASLACVLHVYRTRYLHRLDALRSESARARAARERALERFGYMTEHATDLIAELDERGTLLYVNPAHEEVLGFARDEMVGRSVGEFVAGGVPSTLATELERRVRDEGSSSRVFEMRCKDGGRRTVDAHVRMHRLEGGEVRLLSIARDITQRAAEERALARDRALLEAEVEARSNALASSLRELERSQRLASVGTLAAGIAHQVNNPIAAILASAQYALARAKADGKLAAADVQLAALREIADEARRCGRIVRSMLQFARNEPTEKMPEDAVEIAARVCRQCESYAAERGGSIAFRAPQRARPGEFTVVASWLELEQALLNLVRNSLECREAGVRVEVAVARFGELVRISVGDDGPGIDEAALAHVFDPFFTTRLREGGTGLGLSVAHGVALDHGGDLRVESAPGKGTRFWLELPLAGAKRVAPAMVGDRQP